MPRLHIRHISKPIQDRLFAIRMTSRISLTITHQHHQIHNASQHNNLRVANKQPRQRRVIPRRLALKEDIRPRDIPRRIHRKPEPISHRALRMARDIRSQDIPRHDYRRPNDILQPGTPHQRPAVTIIERREADPQQPPERNQTDGREDGAARIAHVCRDQTADWHDGGLKCACRELQERGVDAVVEAVAFDQGGGEIGHAAVDDAAGGADSDAAEGFGVAGDLEGLVWS